MSRFTRINGETGGTGDVTSGVSRPKVTPSRVYGEQVTMGEPLKIQGDAELRQQIETSLEAIARQRLLEAEGQANTLLEEARIEAQKILEKANAQAKEMIDLAQGQVDQIREEAHESGFKTGFQEGYADASEQVENETVDLLHGAQIMAEGAFEAKRRVLKEFNREALQLVRHISGKILNREIEDSPETLLAMIDQAIESLYLSGKVKVVVSAQIIQDLREFGAKSTEALEQMRRYEFVADPGLELHQIYIISQDGSFDISPATQVDRLLSPLEKELKIDLGDVEELLQDESEKQFPTLNELALGEPIDETTTEWDPDGELP